MAASLSQQTSLLSLWCDIDIIKDLLLPTQARAHPSPHCWTTAAGALLLQCKMSQLIPHCCSRLISPDHMVLAAGPFASAILGYFPPGLKAKWPSKSLQHQNPIGEEEWEVLLNRKDDEEVPVVKSSKFPAQPTEIKNYFQFEKNNSSNPGTCCIPGTGGTGLEAWPGADFVAALRIVSLVLLTLSAVRWERAMFPLFLQHTPASAAVTVSVHTKTGISILWHRNPPGQISHERFPFTVFHSALLITETFLNKIWICSRV